MPEVAIAGPGHRQRTVASVDGLAILFFDPMTRKPHLVFVNDGLADLLGYRPDELLGQSPTVLYDPAEAEAELVAITRALIPPEPGMAPRPMPPPAAAARDRSLFPEPVAEPLPAAPEMPVQRKPGGAPEPEPSASPLSPGQGLSPFDGLSDGPMEGGLAAPSVSELDEQFLSSPPPVEIEGWATAPIPEPPADEDIFNPNPSLSPDFADQQFVQTQQIELEDILSGQSSDEFGWAAERSETEIDLNLNPNSAVDPDSDVNLDLDVNQDLDVNPDLDLDLDLDRAPDLDLSADIEQDIDLDGTAQDHAALGSQEQQYSATQSLRRKDGALVLVHALHTPIPSLNPTAPYVVVQYRDLGRASAETLLADQAAVMGSLSRGHELGRLCHQVSAQVEQELPAGSQCWLAIADADGVLEPVIAGELPFDAVAEIMRIVSESGSDNMKRVVSVDGLPGEFVPIFHARSIKALWYVPMIGAGGKLRGAMMVATDDSRPEQAITKTLDHLAVVMTTAVEHATAEADIAHQRLHDQLTHLPNRALIVDRLGQALARLERDGIALSVLLVDIDRFRSVNDTHGAEVGDQVLLEVAGRLLAAVRLGDTVGRISSDQYLIMCVATSGELDAAAVARRVLRSLSEPVRLADGDTLHITASVGVVVVDEPGPSPAAVISNAESALARATASGRGQMAMYEADLRRHVVDRHETEQALHQAIMQDQLVMHYQPIVEIRTGFMIGAEALVRWERPDYGLLHPPSFIQIAEESELILPMGNWIIDKVCSDLGRWPKSNGRSPMVTINLAAGQLAVDTLVPTVVSALQRNNLHPTRVGFEITESMEIRDLEAAGVNLNRLSELGCRIAIDDFGIGHATLDYIRQFSMADALKIDRSFVAGLDNSKEDTAIVNASIALASSLGLQVIAEGVENMDQLMALEALGCRYAQGYALAHPLPYEDVLALWEQARLYEPDQL